MSRPCPRGAWGLPIIHQTMDRVEYTRRDDQNILVLTKTIEEFL